MRTLFIVRVANDYFNSLNLFTYFDLSASLERAEINKFFEYFFTHKKVKTDFQDVVVKQPV